MHLPQGGGPAALGAVIGAVPAARWAEPGPSPPPPGHRGRHRAPPPCAPRSPALPEVGRVAPQEAEVERPSLRRRGGRQDSPLGSMRMR